MYFTKCILFMQISFLWCNLASFMTTYEFPEDAEGNCKFDANFLSTINKILNMHII